MVKTGRNAPWPCGSGKKYKKCRLSAQPEKRPVNNTE
ncbi:MAG: SEC-C domain-containing protein [Deltaproteobacteria bacterium]|nr:SEC-C domain-containing protein [Deltaproteobacteria bacterium]